MDPRSLWQAWRRDVIVFAVLCMAALGVGLAINRGSEAVRLTLHRVMPDAVSHLGGDEIADAFDGTAGRRRAVQPWTYRARLLAGQQVWVSNRVGGVSVEPSAGASVEVSAVESFRHSNPLSVRFVADTGPDGIAICALWEGDREGCARGARTRYESPARGHNDVAVQFTVRVPRGTRVCVTTINGAIRVRGASAPVTARTVNGSVEVETSAGPVAAATVNGNIRARVRAFGDTGAVTLTTVNGTLSAELPAVLDARVDATTVHGGIQSGYALIVSDGLLAHRVSGTVGLGTRHVDLHTVNGSIRIEKVRADST